MSGLSHPNKINVAAIAVCLEASWPLMVSTLDAPPTAGPPRTSLPRTSLRVGPSTNAAHLHDLALLHDFVQIPAEASVVALVYHAFSSPPDAPVQ